MNRHVKEYYSQFSQESSSGRFHRVISLDHKQEFVWETVHRMAPNLPRGWFELSQLSSEDRVEFTRDFWLSKLPYHHRMGQFLTQFFKRVDAIDLFIVQKSFDDPYEPNLVYSLKDGTGFYRGHVPASDSQIVDLAQFFSKFILPQDYLAFLQIHNGFCKTTDCTGILDTEQMQQAYLNLQKNITAQEPLTTTNGIPVDPASLIPFYESFGMPFFQCFWAEWYPQQEMGNVYYSAAAKTISNVLHLTDSSFEALAFPSFCDWLMFYLEEIR